MRWLRSHYRRWGLIGVGVFQVAIAAAQISGIDFGMVSRHMHGAMSGEHLMHESTAWLLALGLAMVAAGVWPVTAIGVAAITGVYSVALFGYVVVDAFAGDVTATRIASHMPLLLGLAFALLVARERVRADRSGASGAADDADHPAGEQSPPLHDDAVTSGPSTGRPSTPPQPLRQAVVDSVSPRNKGGSP